MPKQKQADRARHVDGDDHEAGLSDFGALLLPAGSRSEDPMTEPGAIGGSIVTK
jgi:hypothetical protein